MRKVLWSAGIAVFACALAFGQAEENLTFEVASVKPAAPPPADGRMFFGSRGGPGTPDPGQITWTNANLKTLLTIAYDVKNYQVNGPAWLDTERYDIIAKVPEGATKEQVNVMWQNLLKERFGMVVHHESKEFQVDELQVAKGGPKLKETALDPNAPPPPPPTGPPPGPPKLDKNGFPEMNGPGLIMLIQVGATGGPVGHVVARAQPLSGLATMLGNQTNRPVVDKTGLTGKYDFSLEYTPNLGIGGLPLPPPPPGAQPGPGAAPGAEASEPGSNLAAAIQQQLGLRLVSGKAKLDVVVVDKAEKTPTEN
jgi:uncharacterized protein (TIGR03435 family)